MPRPGPTPNNVPTAGFANGEAAGTATTLRIDVRLMAGDRRIALVFGADLQPQDKAVPCDRHFTVGPAEELQPLELNVQPKAGSKEVDEKELVAAIEQHGLLFLQKPVTASIAASQFSAAFANR